jgi:PAS domain S-box-containing protein
MTPVDAAALDQALARAGDGISVVSSDGRIVLWNRSAERILGYTAREVAGRPCCEIFAGRDDHGNKVCHPGCHVMTLMRMTEPVQHFDMLVQAKSGQTVWLDVSVMALPTHARNNGYSAGGGNGHSNGFLVMHMFRDVTATKELLAVVRERFAAPPPSEAAIEGGAALTRRELEVLRLVAQGGNTKVVADKLHVSPATIRNHVQNILGKLGAHSRLEAVAYATRHRLL